MLNIGRIMEITGKFGTAKVFTDLIEEAAVSQIYTMMNNDVVVGADVRIMPDVHAGKGCTVGTTIKLNGRVCPNLVGVDIGCGMRVEKIVGDVDFEKFDKVVHEKIQSGFGIYDKSILSKVEENMWCNKLKSMYCSSDIDIARALKSIGSLGSGNHFVEIDRNDNGDNYLVIHSGSRHLGIEVCKYYQEKAYEQMCRDRKGDLKPDIERMKAEGRTSEISKFISENKKSPLSKELAYCSRELYDQYMSDIAVVQEFAFRNRQAMAEAIRKHGGIDNSTFLFDTKHNYVDVELGILRKGAVSAMEGEMLIIPMNMRDGSLICVGKGNPDWNFSAPHGAGRIMSRNQAKKVLTMDEFRAEMKGIYTTSVSESTIDESPMAYKPMQSILDNIGDTVDVVSIIKPVYNFKASEE